MPSSPLPPVHGPRTAAALAAGILLALAGCGESPAAVTPSASPTAAAPVEACTAASIPEAGFVPDPAHSGPLSVGRYSPNGDMQAALVFFHFQNGVRQVFTNLPAATATAAAAASPPGAAGPQTPAHDQLITCDAIEFASADGATGFLGAFRQLRRDAKQQEVTAPPVGDARAAFSDQGQDFAGYPIHGASGAEIAATRGGRFYSVSVFGPSPTLQTATAIMQSMLGPAR